MAGGENLTRNIIDLLLHGHENILQGIPKIVSLDPGLFQDLDEHPDRKILLVYGDNRTPFCLGMKKDRGASFCPVKDKPPAL